VVDFLELVPGFGEQLATVASSFHGPALFAKGAAVGELAFLGLQLVDALLDGALADEPVDEDRLGLADTVGAVVGLGFGGMVPPLVSTVASGWRIISLTSPI
jgi:hypothetical protein